MWGCYLGDISLDPLLLEFNVKRFAKLSSHETALIYSTCARMSAVVYDTTRPLPSDKTTSVALMQTKDLVTFYEGVSVSTKSCHLVALLVL